MKTKILAIVLFLVTFFSISSYSQRYFITDTTEVILLDGTSIYTIDKFSNLKEEAKILVDKIYDIVDNSKMIDDIYLDSLSTTSESDTIFFTVNDRINSDDIKELNDLINIFTVISNDCNKTLDLGIFTSDDIPLIFIELYNPIGEINGNKVTYKCNIDTVVNTNFVNTKYAKDLLSKYTSVLCYKILSHDLFI